MNKAIQSIVLQLGHEELGNADIKDILEAGMDSLDGLLALGIVERKIENGYFVIKVNDLERFSPSYGIQVEKIPTIHNSKGYLTTRYNRDEDSWKQVVAPLVIPTYIFNQCRQNNSIIDVINKQNAIKWKTNKFVLEFERENKKENYTWDFTQECELMRQAVSDIDEFYLGHRFDKRGRLYSDGYLLNYQADEWCKAAISPCIKAEKLTKEGWRQMDIDLANHCGLDKANYDVRVKAVKESYDTTSVNNGKVKKPLLARKNLNAREEAIANDYISDYVVGVDATASGMQILAILANCSETAKLTNLTDISTCYDIYGEACQKILEHTKSDLEISDIRDIVKKALMTRGYNSRKQVEDALDELFLKGIKLTLQKLISILDISDKVKACKDAMNNVLISTFSKLPDSEQIVRYTMPDGFVVEFANIRKASIPCYRKLYHFTYKFDRLGWDKKLNWRALAPNLVHSIDAYICREMIRRCSFQIVTIHDCFYCHPNNVLAMRKQYIKLLKEIQSMNMLEYICKQINPEFEWKINEKLFEISDDENSYCLC